MLSLVLYCRSPSLVPPPSKAPYKCPQVGTKPSGRNFDSVLCAQATWRLRECSWPVAARR